LAGEYWDRDGRVRMEFKLKALTDIWTGGVDTRAKENDRLRDISIVGAVRWWYETLVRACSGWACDITSKNDCCQLKLKQFDKYVKELKNKGESQDIAVQKALEQQICYACQIFGCTNWSKKFLLRIKGKNGNAFIGPMKAEDEITLCFEEVKYLTSMERILLQQTVKLIVEYGSIGGKTVFKPSEDPNKQNEFWHKDFGILAYQNGLPTGKLGKQSLQAGSRNQRNSPNLNYFWFTRKDFIDRIEFKKICNGLSDEWFKGAIGESSKKIFSFRAVKKSWGYARSEEERDTAIDIICSVCRSKFTKSDFITGEKVLENEL
jgi:CRISPR-associated protein Cmr1